MSKKDIVTVENFINEEECNKILDYQKYLTENDLWTTLSKENEPRQNWTKRFCSVKTLVVDKNRFGKEKDIEIAKLCLDIRARIKNTIINEWNLPVDIYPDSLTLVRWPSGETQPAHADYENFGRQPHIYNWRDIGVALYLNDDFEGGRISFPQYNHSVEIKKGMLAFFPGDMQHAHGVKSVSNGCRHTINVFFTFDKRHEDGDNYGI